MPLVAISIRLDKVDEGLLYKAQDGSYWLSCVCVFETDAKNRTLVVQSHPYGTIRSRRARPAGGLSGARLAARPSRRHGRAKASTWRNTRPLPLSTSRSSRAHTRRARNHSRQRRREPQQEPQAATSCPASWDFDMARHPRKLQWRRLQAGNHSRRAQGAQHPPCRRIRGRNPRRTLAGRGGYSLLHSGWRAAHRQRKAIPPAAPGPLKKWGKIPVACQKRLPALHSLATRLLGREGTGHRGVGVQGALPGHAKHSGGRPGRILIRPSGRQDAPRPRRTPASAQVRDRPLPGRQRHLLELRVLSGGC